VKRFWILNFALWIACGSLALAQQFQNPNSKIQNEADATLIVYNEIDPQSLSLAGYYAEKRHIPYSHVIGLACTMNEEITRDEYDRMIAEPLRKIFAERNWWRPPPTGDLPVSENKIRYVVLMRGIPLKIAPTSNYPGDSFDGPAPLNKNEASVDSELAMLGFFSRKISGPATNPYFRSFTPFTDMKIAPMMLVCRLDAPTGEIVRRMIDDSLETEQRGLWGFAYIDARGLANGPLAEGDKWMIHTADEAREHGVPVILDRTEAQFADDYPMRNAALYFGWYSENVTGPFVHEDFRFNKGAIACHIHSTSAATVRDPHQHWVAPLLARGAAATLGNVYEPYLTLTPNFDIFYERLCNGFNFAESAYASVKVLSWMTTFVGDPLYRPFKVVPDDSSSKGAAEWIAYRDGALSWFSDGHAAGEKKLQTSARQMRSGIIFEGLGLLERDNANNPAAALTAFEQAQQCYTNTSDAARIALHRIRTLQAMNRMKDAISLTRKSLKTFANLPAENALRAIEAELAPSPAPTQTR